MEEVIAFVKEHYPHHTFHIKPIPPSGSERQNYIVDFGDKKMVYTYNENVQENEAFFYFSHVFNQLQLNAPTIFEISKDRKTYLQDFVGERSLSQIITDEKHSDYCYQLIRKTTQTLINFQKKSSGQLDFSKSFEYDKYDELPIIHDLYYFKNFLVDVLEIHYAKATLLKEFKAIAEKIETLQPQGLMIRDFQSRNILVNQEDDIYFIDYQSAMKGPLLYDLVSFLYQAKAQLPSSWKQEMQQLFFDAWKQEFSQNAMQESLVYCQLIRFVQVLGAYAFRGLIQRKKHFLDSIFLGLDNLIAFCEKEEIMNNYPELRHIIQSLKSEKYQQKIKNLIHAE